MKVLAAIVMGLVAIGCESSRFALHDAPLPPGVARVRVHVLAKAKNGVKESVQRVATYDAAPSQAARPTGQYEHVDYAHLGNIIVWLMPDRSGGYAMSTPVTVDLYSSNIRAASVGQPVALVNDSLKPLSMYSVSDGNEFDLQIAPKSTGTFLPKSEGLIEILVDPSQPPVALVYAAPTPWVKAVQSGQTISFDVPSGRYTVHSWHPRLPASETHVSAVDDKVTDCTIEVGVNALSSTSSSSSSK